MAALWVACLALCACGKFNRLENGGFTDVKFTRSFMSYGDGFESMATLNGGLMIYAYSSSYVTNKLLTTEDDANKSITLPNGQYTFYAVGYTSASGPLSSNNRCAVVGAGVPITLDGTAKTVTLNMSQANCADGELVNNTSSFSHGGTSASAGDFGRLQLLYCGTGANTAIGSFVSTDTCGYSATAYQWGQGEGTSLSGMMSYRISLPVFKRSGGQYQKLDSGITGNCHYVSTGGEQIGAVTDLSRVPLGNSAKPGAFPVEISAWGASDCSGTPAAVHYFNDGMLFGPSSGSPSTLSRMLSISSSINSEKSALYFIIGT